MGVSTVTEQKKDSGKRERGGGGALQVWPEGNVLLVYLDHPER